MAMHHLRVIFLSLFFLATIQSAVKAQKGVNDTILLSAVIFEGDTIPSCWKNEVIYQVILDKEAKARRVMNRMVREAQNQLRYNVYKVYPYAVSASIILHDIDSALAGLNSRDAKRIYKRRKEDELNNTFKDELENLSITQGQILVKLIARQTGKPCYQIIKELKGGFNARIWQTVALLFSNNLKNNYDPLGADKGIEAIVLEIENRGRY